MCGAAQPVNRDRILASGVGPVPGFGAVGAPLPSGVGLVSGFGLLSPSGVGPASGFGALSPSGVGLVSGFGLLSPSGVGLVPPGSRGLLASARALLQGRSRVHGGPGEAGTG
jgi:hypothetical protein